MKIFTLSCLASAAFNLFYSSADAHTVTGNLGSVEIMAPGHYHYHLPFGIDFSGNVHFENPFSAPDDEILANWKESRHSNVNEGTLMLRRTVEFINLY